MDLSRSLLVWPVLTRSRMAGFEVITEVAAPNEVRYPSHKHLDSDNSVPGLLLRSIRHWLSWMDPSASGEAFGTLVDRITELETAHEHEYKRFWLDGRTSAGVALQRLQATARLINPPPPTGTPDQRMLERVISRQRGSALVEAIFDTWVSSDPARSGEVASASTATRSDLKCLCLEIRRTILLRRSHLGLMKRFSARCERYDTAILRQLGDSKQPEAALTLRFARFLFDQGLNPIVDPKIAHLRPDVMDPHLGAPIYVEAKQYNKNPVGLIRKAVAQMADTWGRLVSTYALPEAFLLVFRRAGRRVELPEVVFTEGRTLHTMVVDLGKAEVTGSQQRLKPIVIGKDDVLDWVTGQQRRPSI